MILTPSTLQAIILNGWFATARIKHDLKASYEKLAGTRAHLRSTKGGVSESSLVH